MARLVSPEHAGGGGLNHRKWSMSLRGTMERGEAMRVYGLFEWARTAEYNGVRNVFNFQSVLAEAAVSHGATRLAARFERTSRPEEERLLDPFRSARPHADENIIGVTRWHIVTGRVDRSFTLSRMTLQPFTEVAWLRVSEITGALFEPVTFYGDDTFWSLSAGVRLGVGMSHERAGRYGVAGSDHARSHE
jgi:hypothetical protein